MVHTLIKTWKKDKMYERVEGEESITLFDISNLILAEIPVTKFKKRKCLHCSAETFYLLKMGCCNKFICYYCILTMDGKSKKFGMCCSKCNNYKGDV
jgi:hypothetical protein